MKIAIECLQPDPHLSETLVKDGWTIELLDGRRLLAEHPGAFHESQARARLDRLGLLTSRRLRIQFRRTPAGDGAEQSRAVFSA